MTAISSTPIAGRVSQAAAGVLVLVAGVLEIAAQFARWTPCLAGRTQLCHDRQDQRYDSFLPTWPWTPTGPGYEQFMPAPVWVPLPGAATPTGMAFLLLAVAFALTVRAGAPGRSGWGAVTLVAWWGFVVLTALVGAVNVASGLAGEPLEITAMVAPVWWWWGPLLGIGLAFRVVLSGPGGLAGTLLAAVLVIVGLRGSIAEYVGGMFVFDSVDTPPFVGGPGVVALVVLGAVLMITAGRRTPTRGNS